MARDDPDDEQSLIAEAMELCFTFDAITGEAASTLERVGKVLGLSVAELQPLAVEYVSIRWWSGRFDYDGVASVLGVSRKDARNMVLARRAQDSHRKCKRCKKLKAVAVSTGTCRECREETDSRCRPVCRGVGLGQHPRPLPTPCKALPGSPEKIEILCRRAAAEEQLWHDDDPRVVPPDGGERLGKLWLSRRRCVVEEPNDDFED